MTLITINRPPAVARARPWPRVKEATWFTLRASLLLFAIATLLLSSDAWTAAEEVIARVNDDVVTRDELARLLDDPLAERSLRRELGGEVMPTSQLERLALQKLIERRLFLQEAKRRKIEVSDDALDQALLALRGRFEDLDDFAEWMQDRGLDDQSLMQDLREQVIITRVWEALVDGLSVPEEQLRDYYDTHHDEITIGQEVRLRIIAVESRGEAEEILAAVEGGASFAQAAHDRSIGRLAPRYGDSGWIRDHDLPLPLRRAVALLEAGDVAGPLEDRDQNFLLVGLEDRRLLKAGSLDESRSEITRRLLPIVWEQAVAQWMSEQKERAVIEIYLERG